MTIRYQGPQLDQLPENVREFWEEKQRELEEKLAIFSYAILVKPTRVPFPEKGGILYLMERNLWFEDFQKPPLFFLNRTPKYKKTLIQIPRQSITSVELVNQSALEERFQGIAQHSGFFQNLLHIFKPDPVYVLISGHLESEGPFTYAFRELNDPEMWRQNLENL